MTESRNTAPDNSRKELMVQLQEVCRGVAEGRVAVAETAALFLERINRLDQKIGSYLCLDPQALEQAHRIDRRLAEGGRTLPLAGVMLGVKDLMLCRGLPTTGGSRARHSLDREDRDAEAIGRLKRAGAVVLGKQSLHEFAFGITNENEHFGPVRNPWNLDRISGGSSGGSAAAVAAGLCHAAVGTDTRGSIRIPASCCGVCGLKPTFGAVSIDGVIPLSPSLDHVGPIARTVEDIEILFRVMSPGYQRQPPLPEKPVIGWPEPWLERVDSEVRRAVREALGQFVEAGFEVQEVEIVPTLNVVLPASDLISRSEAYEIHEAGLRECPELYGPKVRERLLSGSHLGAVDLVRALRVRSHVTEAFERLFRQVDLLLCPSTPVTAPPLGTEKVVWPDGDELLVPAMVRLLAAQNMAGVPALSIPCGFSSEGLPIGLQLIARRQRERYLLESGKVFQSRTGWHRSRPPGFAEASR